MMAREFREVACRLGAALVAVLTIAASTPALAQVLVVLSDESAVYTDVAVELKNRLAALREGTLQIDVVTTAKRALEANADARYALVVTVGATAARDVLTHHSATGSSPPTLCLLVPRRTFEALQGSGEHAAPRRLSAIYIEQPIARQLDLISLALPSARRIGVVLGPESRSLAADLREGARELGFEVNRSDVGETADVGRALQQVLAGSDVLLALPDPVAVNASTAYGVLVTSYRAQVPVAGFSRAFVDAGALVAVYSTACQQTRQGAEIAAALLSGGAALPPPQYPRYFTVGVNFFAARSLGLSMENEATLAEALAERSRRASEAPEHGRRRISTTRTMQ